MEYVGESEMPLVTMLRSLNIGSDVQVEDFVTQLSSLIHAWMKRQPFHMKIRTMNCITETIMKYAESSGQTETMKIDVPPNTQDFFGDFENSVLAAALCLNPTDRAKPFLEIIFQLHGALVSNYTNSIGVGTPQQGISANPLNIDATQPVANNAEDKSQQGASASPLAH